MATKCVASARFVAYIRASKLLATLRRNLSPTMGVSEEEREGERGSGEQTALAGTANHVCWLAGVTGDCAYAWLLVQVQVQVPTADCKYNQPGNMLCFLDFLISATAAGRFGSGSGFFGPQLQLQPTWLQHLLYCG